jgi:pimeloyl-ACP methyl ester carboxylesterase
MTSTVPTPGDEAVTAVSQNGHHRPDVYGPGGRSPWLDVDWRDHQRWVQVGDRPVNTIDLGSGPAIVFVHGLSGSWPNWLEQLPEIAADHRAIALDLPGFGHSPMPQELISMSGYTRLLDELLDELQVDSATVVGNSMGGLISAKLAISFPERVNRLVLVSPGGISTYHDPRGRRILAALRRLEPVIAAYTAWVASRSETMTARPLLREATLGVVTSHPGRLPGPLAAEQLRGAGKPGFAQAIQGLYDCDLRGRLPEIACPTLIVWGERDRLITVRDADVFAELIPDSRKVLLPDTGHLSMLERPAIFNGLLRDLLED